MKIILATFLLVFVFSLVGRAQDEAIARAAFEAGNRAARAGQYEKALRKYRLVFGNSQDLLAETYYNIGVCYYHLGKHEEAVRRYQKAIELRRGHYQKAAYALGMALVELKEWQAAKRAFTEAVRLSDDKDADALFDLGMVSLRLEDAETAARCFREAIKNRENFAASHNNLGVLLAFENRFLEAEREFQIAFRQSKGELTEAEINLEICRLLIKNEQKSLTARFVLAPKNQFKGD